jgi:hypothetical protein
MANKKIKEINLGEDFGAVAVIVNGARIEIGANGDVTSIKPANGNTSTAIAAAKEALEIGDRMKDGTVVIAVDLEKNTALFAPEGIFGGSSDFEHQDGVVKNTNEQSLAGHKDWRRITDEEAGALAVAWDRVAPAALQDSHAPWFWGASNICRGGEFLSSYDAQDGSRPVPVVRSGPARS